MSPRLAAFALVCAIALPAGLVAGRGQAGAAGDEWHSFEGSWSVSGRRETVPTETGRAAAIVKLSGAVRLSTGGDLNRGFRGEVIGFDDARSVRLGRWVWTDDRREQIFGELTGDPLETGGRLTATITGGTGRYAGIEGEFAFTWQYVVSAESGTVQGRAAELEGRYRRVTRP
jgi:hypothetical protein